MKRLKQFENLVIEDLEVDEFHRLSTRKKLNTIAQMYFCWRPMMYIILKLKRKRNLFSLNSMSIILLTKV